MHAAAKASFRIIGWACQAPHSQAQEGASGTQTYVEGVGPLSSDYSPPPPPQARLPVFTGGWAGTVQLVSALDNSNLMPMAAGRVRVHVVSFPMLTCGRQVCLLLGLTGCEPWTLGEWL